MILNKTKKRVILCFKGDINMKRVLNLNNKKNSWNAAICIRAPYSPRSHAQVRRRIDNQLNGTFLDSSSQNKLFV